VSALLIVCAALAIAAATALVWPLLRGQFVVDGESTSNAPSVAVVSAALLILGAAGLYAVWSNWQPSAPPAAAGASGEMLAPVEMLGRLARRLERNPDDLEGWLMLGRSYAVIEQYPLAARAFQRADRLASGNNVEALTGWAETLVLQNESEIEGRAGRLFERALALDPSAPKALFFGAVGAQRRGELQVARGRFAKLLELGAPAEIRPILEQQIGELDLRIAQGVPAGGPASGTAPNAASQSASGAAPVSSTAAVIRLRVSVAPSLQAAAGGAKALFVAVRVPGQPGPPLAARRLAATLPTSVELTPADAMMPGRSFASGQQVEIVARLSRDGTANAATGDPVGRLRYDVGKDGVRELLIDATTP
jgi:cytochrome c-type biogenesis protein CcmH